MITRLIDVAEQCVSKIRKDEKTPVSLQLGFWESSKKKYLERVAAKIKGLKVEVVNDSTILLQLERDKTKASALVTFLDPYVLENVQEKFPIEHSNVALVVIAGKRGEREALTKILYKIGMRRGWLKQGFIRNLDELVKYHELGFELLSLVYELRIYGGRVFTAAGTANFWPKGVESIKEALEEYLLPIEKARGYYIFIKSLRFRLMKDKTSLGIYAIDRWGRISIAPRSDVNAVLRILPGIAESILENYMEYALHYSVRVDKVKGFTVYYLEKATSIYFSAVEPGSNFFNTIKLMVGKPTIWNNRLIILPIEIGNPRLVARVIDEHSGMAVTLTATYNGIRLVPAPGSTDIDAEMIDLILSIFRNLISE